MTIATYLKEISVRHKTGKAREHSYRADLQNLLQEALPDILITNEAARIECGAPDYILTHKNSNIDIGYIEAKDIGKSLDDAAYTEQFTRYKQSLSNLIITDYLEFRFYRDGELVTSTRIAEVKNGSIKPIPVNYATFTGLIKEFGQYTGQTITSASTLAIMMAAKAKLLAEIIKNALLSDEESKENTTLKEQLDAFRDVLMHEIDAQEFSDIYAQTIAYGMFAARLNDKTPDTFSRQEAAQLIPRTNPFLRKLFQYISGYDIDSRIEWIVDALAELFRSTNTDKIVKDFGRSDFKNDPLIHFYETFLAEYDPLLRKSRGVWYTPEPVVNFIVKSVDHILKREFGVKKGLADNSKTSVSVQSQIINNRTKKLQQVSVDVHKIQILDPATGTGTFLAQIIKYIYSQFEGQAGTWSKYVEEHLVPRLNGFELLMASYAMAHLKLDLLLHETGYKPKSADRLRVYLTNSLEEHHPDTGTLFASWLSAEANEANHIKRDTPVMIVIGNPPYSRHSMNKGNWMSGLLDTYKKEPNSNAKLRERNSKWLNDDYVKFMRYAQHFVQKSGYGITAFITNHGYIDNPTFRGMRWNLLKNYNKIVVIDLHGNSNIDERVPAGKNNDNVFDIKQGVAIFFAFRTGPIGKNDLAIVEHTDVYGTRDEKYAFLDKHSLSEIDFQAVELKPPYYYFKNKSYNNEKAYLSWPSLSDIFMRFSTGYYTSCDDIVIADDTSTLRKKILAANPGSTFDPKKVRNTTYRPFDFKKIYYDASMLTRARESFVQALPEENVIIITGKSSRSRSIDHFYVSSQFSELKCGEYTKGSYMFPARIKGKTGGGLIAGDDCNVENSILQNYRKICGGHIKPEQISYYIYAVLYSGAYREMFAEQLCDDFARIPYPRSAKTFEDVSELGEELAVIHMAPDQAEVELITTYPIDGEDYVARPIGKSDWEIYDDESNLGRIWINETQYFEGIPLATWELGVGGYQPAQKWLKDRRNTCLSYDEIIYYQKIIAVLNETIRISAEIDEYVSKLID